MKLKKSPTECRKMASKCLVIMLVYVHVFSNDRRFSDIWEEIEREEHHGRLMIARTKKEFRILMKCNCSERSMSEDSDDRRHDEH